MGPTEITLGLVLLGLVLLYCYWVFPYSYWRRQGVPFIPARFPFGSHASLTIFDRFQGYVWKEMFDKAAPHPYFGMYLMRTPVLVLRDPDVIRWVLTKGFSHFTDRFSSDAREDDILSHNLFNLCGKRWKALRLKLTPTFTGTRMKAMFPLFLSCAETLNEELLRLTKLEMEVDIKETIARFTTDIICSCAFGIESNTLSHPDHEIRKIGKQFFTRSKMFIFKLIVMRTFLQPPSKRRLTPIQVEKFIIKLIRETFEYRKNNNVRRNDFLDLLIQLNSSGSFGKDEKHESSFAGFETSSSVQSFCLYELAMNPEIQAKLREEIDRTVAMHGGVTYQAVLGMNYLDMVISETMRKYPTLPVLLRSCTEAVVLGGGARLEAGQRLVVPVYALHHDPGLFPRPGLFLPERFAPGAPRRPFAYLPFGAGPRSCIGNRFGLLQTKMGIIAIIKNFYVLPCKKTKLEMDGSPTITTVKGPIILKLAERLS